MITKKEINGRAFKKELQLNKCGFQYHNKNNSGGNFGLNFYKEEEFNEKVDFSLHGAYNKDGEIVNLRIMSIRVSCFIIKVPLKELSGLSDLIEYMKKVYISLGVEIK